MTSSCSLKMAMHLVIIGFIIIIIIMIRIIKIISCVDYFDVLGSSCLLLTAFLTRIILCHPAIIITSLLKYKLG